MQTLQQFCLRWNNHQPNFISVFTNLLNHETLVDVTIACEGKHLQAHKVVLSACSSYFQSLFTINPCQHPIVILKDIKFSDLRTMVDFMYYGEVNVSQEQLPAILKIAEMLKIKGLADGHEQNSMIKSHSTSSDKADLLTPGDSNWGSTERRSPSPMSPAARRKRLRKSSTGSGSGSTERTSEELISDSGPQVRIESVRSLSRQSLRNSNQEPSTDSEPKEGSQDSGAEDHVSRLSLDSRQPSHERQTYPDKRQLSSESRQLSYESRQYSTESRQGSFEVRQLSHDGRHSAHLSSDSRQASHESRLSHESSIESISAEDVINSNLSPVPGQTKVGTKRGRLLMRQSRIKKELDTHTSPDSEPSSPGFSTTHLTVPPGKIERQRSEPTPSTHSPPLSTLTSSSSLNLLTVPQPTFLVKQHSFPCLPTNTSSSPPPTQLTQQSTLLVQRPLPIGVSPITTLKPIASLHPIDIEPRASSPTVNTDQLGLPIVRIISDEPATKVNSGYRLRIEEPKRGLPLPQPVQTATIPTAIAPTTPVTDITNESNRSVHCPALRTGPALGCNFCWNTIDAHGRILRRKTKYHCPECQTNLCIVPCFQEYHQRHSPSHTSIKSETQVSHN